MLENLWNQRNKWNKWNKWKREIPSIGQTLIKGLCTNRTRLFSSFSNVASLGECICAECRTEQHPFVTFYVFQPTYNIHIEHIEWPFESFSTSIREEEIPHVYFNIHIIKIGIC